MQHRHGTRDRAGDWAEPGSLAWAKPRQEQLDQSLPGGTLRGDRTQEVLVHRSGRPYASRVRDAVHVRLDPPASSAGEDWWRSWGPLVWLVSGLMAGVDAAAVLWPTSWCRVGLGACLGLVLTASWLDRTPSALWGGRCWPGVET